MGFAGWDAGKEHKFKKPRKGFEKQKNLQKQLLMKSKKFSVNKKQGLNQLRLEKIKTIKQWKIVKEFLIVLVFLFPVIIFGIHKFSSSFSRLEFLSYDYRIPDEYRNTYFSLPTDDRGYHIRGYEALEEKKYEAAIYYFSEMLKYSGLRNDGYYGLIGTYLESCKNSQKLCNRAEQSIAKLIDERPPYLKEKVDVEKFKKEILSHNQEMITYFRQIGKIAIQ